MDLEGTEFDETIKELATSPHGWAILLDRFVAGEARIVAAFREAGATSARRAQRFHAHSLAEERAFMRLLTRGVIREPARGRYYLDSAG